MSLLRLQFRVLSNFSSSIRRSTSIVPKILPYSYNFRHFSTETVGGQNGFNVISNSDTVEEYFQPYKELLGSDYEGYRGHIYRVLSYTLYFLRNEDQTLVTKYRPSIEIALVYHDIGLWTDSTLSYLEPSIERVKEKLGNNHSNIALITDIIDFHHKFTPYKSDKSDEMHGKIVESCRKADWIDATKGKLTKGMPKENIKKAFDIVPVNGFYDTLAGFGGRLHGKNVFKIVKNISKIYKY